MLDQGLIACAELDADAGPAIAALARQYADIRPQLADLSLLYVAAREKLHTVFAIDHRDFVIYRDHNGSPFRLVP